MIYPFTAGLLGAVFFLILLLWRLPRIGLAGLALSLAWLWLWSMPAFTNSLIARLEAPWPYLPPDQVPKAEAIVVLGGGFHGGALDWPQPQLQPGANRYWYAAQLFHANRGESVILSGGRSEAAAKRGGLTEAASGARFLRDLGVPEAALLLDHDAMTTRENAVNIAPMLKANEIDQFILVTSATHMRRSVGAFRAVGLEPIPAAGHFRFNPDDPGTWRRWLPSENGAVRGRIAFHELVGHTAYRLRGWVDR